MAVDLNSATAIVRARLLVQADRSAVNILAMLLSLIGFWAVGSGLEASSPASRWQVRESVSKMDDSRTVVLVLDADTPVHGWPGDTTTPKLVLRCQEGKLDAYVSTGLSPRVEARNLDGATVKVRFDKDQAVDYRMGQSTDREALFFSEPKRIILTIAQHDTLLFRFTPFNSSPQETSFAVSGLTTALPSLQAACGWNPEREAREALLRQEQEAEEAAQAKRERAATLHVGNLTRDKEELPALLKDLRSKTPQKRANAAIQLGSMHPDLAPQIVPALLTALQDTDPDVRLRVVRALGDVGPYANTALPSLRPLVEDASPKIREEAVRAIGRIQQGESSP